jgi:hypothetical protein
MKKIEKKEVRGLKVRKIKEMERSPEGYNALYQN